MPQERYQARPEAEHALGESTRVIVTMAVKVGEHAPVIAGNSAVAVVPVRLQECMDIQGRCRLRREALRQGIAAYAVRLQGIQAHPHGPGRVIGQARQGIRMRLVRPQGIRLRCPGQGRGSQPPSGAQPGPGRSAVG